MSRERSTTVTIREVAKEAGVSVATAGRVLGGYGYASNDVRERVMAKADELGYRPNHLARSLITGKTRTIGVVGADIENPFFAGAMRGIGDIAREQGYGAILTNSDEDLEIEIEMVRLLQKERVDGIIVAPADVQRTEHLQLAASEGTAVAVFDRPVAGLEVDSVAIDNVDAARQGIDHLIGLGHSRIGIVAELSNPREAQWASLLAQDSDVDPATLSPSAARLHGYLIAHWEAGLEVDPALVGRTGSYERESARLHTERLLKLDRPPTALFTVDNLMSSGSYEALRSSGVKIPDQLSLVAFDDLDWMTYVTPTVTAVEQPVYKLGLEAARLVLSRIEEPDLPARRVILPTRLVERESTRAL